MVAEIRKKILLNLFGIILFSVFGLTMVFSQVIEVTRTVPEEIKLGEILEVNIGIKNMGSEEVQVFVKELVGDAEPIDPPEVNEPESSTDCKYCVSPSSFYSWDLTIQPMETEDIIYKIKPNNIGDFLLSPTVVTTSDGETYKSDSSSTRVRCNENGVCEPDLIENYFNCPEDCPSGSEDNTCDLIDDGICDPDCTGEADSDCAKGFNWLYVIIGAVLLIVVLVFILSKKKN